MASGSCQVPCSHVTVQQNDAGTVLTEESLADIIAGAATWRMRGKICEKLDKPL